MNEPMTPAAICEVLLQSADLSRDGSLSLLIEYRAAKRRTGCPVVLEDDVIDLARRCQEALDELRAYLTRAAKEAAEALAGLDVVGTRFDRTWFTLDRRENGEDIGKRLREQRYRFNDLLKTWATVADRVQATDEEKVTAAQDREKLLAERWQREDMERVRSAARVQGIGARSKADIAARLAALGVEP